MFDGPRVLSRYYVRAIVVSTVKSLFKHVPWVSKRLMCSCSYRANSGWFPQNRYFSEGSEPPLKLAANETDVGKNRLPYLGVIEGIVGRVQVENSLLGIGIH